MTVPEMTIVKKDGLAARFWALLACVLLSLFMAPSVAQAADLSVNVDYGTPKCGSAMTFTVTADGGTGDYKYWQNIPYLMKDDGTRDEWIMDSNYMSHYSTNNTFDMTFYASGTYQLSFYVMDLGSSPIKTAHREVTVRIQDSAYPTVQTIAKNVAAQCLAAGCKTDYEKALWLHDWIVDHCVYDRTYVYCGSEGALARGLGTCEAYYSAYKRLLDEVGIANGRITGNNHVWNAVKINGRWYQVDATWDDPGYSDSKLDLKHFYFGLNDQIMSLVHSDHKTVAGYESNSLVDNYFVRNGTAATWARAYSATIDQKLAAGQTTFTFSCDNSSYPPGYKDVINNITAYQLSSATLDVTYKDDVFTAKVLSAGANAGNSGSAAGTGGSENGAATDTGGGGDDAAVDGGGNDGNNGNVYDTDPVYDTEYTQLYIETPTAKKALKASASTKRLGKNKVAVASLKKTCNVMAYGDLSYSKVSVKASAKAKTSSSKAKKLIRVGATNGKITVLKGMGKGTYTVTVKVKAAATQWWPKASQTVKVKIIVK